MARVRCVWQMLCLLVLIFLVSPCGCDNRVGILADEALPEPDPVIPTLEKSTTHAVPYQQVSPVFEPLLPTHLAAPSTKSGDGDSPPVRSHISHAGTNQEKRHGTINPSQDSQAYHSARPFDSGEDNADTSMPSRRPGLPSKSVGNDEDRNGQAPEVYPGRSQFLNDLNVGNAPSSTQKAHTDMHRLSVDRSSESSVLKEAEKKQESVVQAQGSFVDRVSDDSFKDYNTQISQTGQKDIGLLKRLENHFSENDVKKESQQRESDWGKAQNTEYKDSFKSEKSPSNDDIGVLGVLVESVSKKYSGVETDEHMAKIQTLPSLVSRGYTEHTTLSSSKSNENFRISGSLGSRPVSFEGAKLNVSHSVGNLAESPLSTMRTEKISPEMNSGIASQEKDPTLTADQVADKAGGGGGGGGYAERPPQPSFIPTPDTDRALAKEQTTNIADNEINYDGEDWWYFDPDYKEEDEEHPSLQQQSSPGPQRTVAESQGVTDGEEIHEKVVNEEDVAQKKKKKTNTPKDSIIIYTVAIVILVIGIVLFFLWKNTPKKVRGRSPLSIIPTGEEGKRLLDHPFV